MADRLQLDVLCFEAAERLRERLPDRVGFFLVVYSETAGEEEWISMNASEDAMGAQLSRCVESTLRLPPPEDA